jgi:hypothetical protein
MRMVSCSRVRRSPQNLDVLEALFDHYFFQPAQLAAKKAALNKKLTDLGKAPMK